MSQSKHVRRGHKGQHWVAESYLRAWCRPRVDTREPFLWRFDKDGSNPKAKAPKKVFKASDLYTIWMPDGTRNLVFEDVMCRLESDFAKTLKHKVLPCLNLTPEETGDIMAFMAAQKVRTPSFRDHWAGQLSNVLAVAEEARASIRAASPEQRRAMASMTTLSDGGESMTIEELQQVRDHPFHLISPSAMVDLGNIFAHMSLIIHCTDDEVGFITSDAPCVFYDPGSYKQHPMFRGPALASPTIEVSMPLAPNRLAVLTHRRGMATYVGNNERGSWLLDEYNRRTRFHASRNFVVNSKFAKPIWFDPGTPPPDAWKPPADDDQPANDEPADIEDDITGQ